LILYAFLGKEAVGVFSAAFRLVAVAGILPTVLGSVFLPRLARLVAMQSDRIGAETAVFARIHMLAGFAVAAVMAAEAPAVVNLVFGAAYAKAIPLVRIFSTAVLFNFAICGYTNCLIAYGRDRVVLLAIAVSCIASVGGGLMMTSLWGYVGAACAVACTDLAGWLASLGAYRRTAGRWNLDVCLGPLAGSIGFVAASFLLQHAGAPLWLRLPACSLAYWLCVRRSVSAVLGQLRSPLAAAVP